MKYLQIDTSFQTLFWNKTYNIGSPLDNRSNKEYFQNLGRRSYATASIVFWKGFIFLALLVFLFPYQSVKAQNADLSPENSSPKSTESPKSENSEAKSLPKPKEETKSKPGDSHALISGKEEFAKFNGEFEHRLQFRMGVGLGRLDSAILNETGKNWFTNSIFRQGVDPGAPLAIPISESKNLQTTPQYRDITYGYNNKYEIQFAEDLTLGKYGRENPASVNFFAPRTDNYWASAFEGNRLLRFEGKSQHLRFSYIHPVLGWLMIGPSLNIHRYSEKNQISYGSYASSRPQTGASDTRTTWSFGGDANAEFSMKGIVPGILMKMKLTDWWEIRSRFELLDRKGNFSVFGSQLISQESSSTGTGYMGVLPIYGGKARDKGTLFFLESSFRYCRFSLDIGLIRQDFKRSYSEYYGDTLGSVLRTDYSARSVLIGFSELSNSAKQTITEIYIMPGISFHYDEEGIY